MKQKHFPLNHLAGILLAAVLSTHSSTGVAAEEVIRTLDNQRQYLLYIPTSYQAAQPTPLVLFFHGGGGHMEQAAKEYGWREKAEQEGFIVAFPNGTGALRKQHLLATWNAGNCCGRARDERVDDIAFVKQVIADIKGQINIDTGKVFATGMSNGGMLSHRLACDMADTFKAVAAVAGTDNTQTCQPSRPISVLHIHAKDDTHVLFEGGAGKDVFRDESKVADFTSVNETISRWVKRNGLGNTPPQTRNIPGASIERYAAKNNSAQVELVVTETGGHSWPGGKRVRGKQPSRAINATDFIWRFFSGNEPMTKPDPDAAVPTAVSAASTAPGDRRRSVPASATELRDALLGGQRRRFDDLLRHGADPDATGPDGQSVTHLAARHEDPSWLDALLTHGADPNVRNTRSGARPIMDAIQSHRDANIEQLLRAKADPNATNNAGNTALHVAAATNRAAWSLKLLEAGANPRTVNGAGSTFQAYQFMTPDDRLSADIRRDRKAIRAWLRKHGVAVER